MKILAGGELKSTRHLKAVWNVCPKHEARAIRYCPNLITDKELQIKECYFCLVDNVWKEVKEEMK
jgi:hypothetical protein